MFGQSFATEVIFLFSLSAGIILIILAIMRSGSLKIRPPMEIVLSKLGINLKLDTLAFLILVGFLIAGVGGFFLYQGYEGRLKGMKIELDKTSSRLTALEETIKEFKDYDLRFRLDFSPEKDIPYFKETEIIASVRRKGERDYIPYDKIIVDRDIGGITVEVGDLRPGDSLLLNAQYSGKTWVSPRTQIPESRIPMTKN